MTYRDKVISAQADIDEGQLETSQESLERERMAADFTAALDEADAEMRSRAVEDIIQGIDWSNGEQMPLTQWAEALDDIGATPQQRLPYEQARQDEETSRQEFIEDHYDDLDRYPEGDYNVTH